jgi:geranylgeranyl pyrophosphate synthase
VLPLVRAQVADAVVTHADPGIHANLIRLLSRPGYALHPEGRCRAGRFALEVYRAVRRRYDRTALVTAAAVELQMQSAYVFDAVSDGEAGDSQAEDLALAIALLTAGTAAAAEASADSPHGAGAMRHFCAATGGACAGQYLDAALERRGAATLEEALHMTRLKSGSLGSFAAGFAVRIAGGDADTIPVFESIGFNLFTCAQLVDDQRDARTKGSLSDMARGKATVPVVFQSRIDSTAREDGRLSPEVRENPRSGALVCAAVLALAHLARARADLHLLANRGYPTEPLHRYMAEVESEAARTWGAVGGGVVA